MSRHDSLFIAIVDDDESLCRSLSRLLHAVGMVPSIYSSAESFLADPAPPDFDCLVLDIELGGLSGIELQQQLTDQGNRTPVIFITAHDEPSVREQAIAGGCEGFFGKSDSGADVIAAIRRAAS